MIIVFHPYIFSSVALISCLDISFDSPLMNSVAWSGSNPKYGALLIFIELSSITSIVWLLRKLLKFWLASSSSSCS